MLLASSRLYIVNVDGTDNLGRIYMPIGPRAMPVLYNVMFTFSQEGAPKSSRQNRRHQKLFWPLVAHLIGNTASTRTGSANVRRPRTQLAYSVVIRARPMT